jgi:hypothetical protein
MQMTGKEIGTISNNLLNVKYKLLSKLEKSKKIATGYRIIAKSLKDLSIALEQTVNDLTK